MENKFVRRIFSTDNCLGNTAYVWLCKQASEFENTQQLQGIARKSGYSATAFVLPQNEALGLYLLRWFSAKGEIQFCGHATLAAADVVFFASTTIINKICFHSVSNEIQVVKNGSENYIMRLNRVKLATIKLSYALAKVLNNELVKVKQSHAEDGYLIIQLPNKACVANFDFDSHQYGKLTRRALIVTAQDKTSLHSLYFRYFAPQYGNKEDPATGSAAPLLAEFWQLPFEQVYDCYQLSMPGAFYQVLRGKECVNIFATVTDAR
ncbi:PhzF family phenazine biosynthesis protein [Thalassotalea sp. ND16A]|uniref:PhzF family phenazine biosynthesis protein n=1 Tax=Thalassotalea sp. ND16A TaxID=1535422 RepID=UPI000519F110|nr:PhzF family phenazine biosynthesis protein [Thalassotalea sp. ND16A]KGJ96027.1 hypothetical protein ND16A_1086 [Thalassotalea sp. ND16A]